MIKTHESHPGLNPGCPSPCDLKQSTLSKTLICNMENDSNFCRGQRRKALLVVCLINSHCSNFLLLKCYLFPCVFTFEQSRAEEIWKWSPVLCQPQSVESKECSWGSPEPRLLVAAPRDFPLDPRQYYGQWNPCDSYYDSKTQLSNHHQGTLEKQGLLTHRLWREHKTLRAALDGCG